MTKNPSLQIVLSSLLGLLIGGVALAAGVWARQAVGPNLTAIDLWVYLRSMLTSNELLTITPRVQAIFTWLTIVFAAFAAQFLITILMFYQQKLTGWLASVLVWGLTLVSTLVLLIGYNGQFSGVVWLGIASILALVGEVWGILVDLKHHRGTAGRDLALMEQRWQSIFDEAVEQKQCFSILAVQTTPPLSFDMLERIKVELRGRDQVESLRDRVYILLWQTPTEHTPLIADKLSGILQGGSRRVVVIGSVDYPEDGSSLNDLLMKANTALDSARSIGGSVIIPFSTPGSPKAVGALAHWEQLLAEAAGLQLPVALLYFQTTRTLSLTEKHAIQQELRGRDLVTILETGFYVFLWNTTRSGGQIVLTKLQQVLVRAKIENHSVMAVFPEDGQELAGLLAVLNTQHAQEPMR